MAYGSTDDIAALCPNWVNSSGVFDSTTTPTLAQVTTWVTQVNAALNAILREFGFTVDVTDADVTPLLDLWVNEEVAQIAESIHGMGRFGPRARGRSSGAKSRQQLIMADAREFVAQNQSGLEGEGATRDQAATGGGFGYRNTDESGDEVKPVFQREQFDHGYEDWDT